jgi:hypothetical protein
MTVRSARSAAVIVRAHGTVDAPPRLSWLGVRPSGTHSPFPPCRARTVTRFLGIAGYTAHPVRSFRSLVMAGGMVVDRFGPVEFIDARDRLPSVEATREPVPPVLQAVELPISLRPRRSLDSAD